MMLSGALVSAMSELLFSKVGAVMSSSTVTQADHRSLTHHRSRARLGPPSTSEGLVRALSR